MSRKKLVLAYHTENQDVAKEIDKHFSSLGYSFKHLTNAKGAVGTQILEEALPAILLLSENFMKSASCMEQAIEWTQKMLNLDLLLPIVVDGKIKNELTGKMESKETTFQRVSDIIKYMNYWQERYLELRRKRRTASAKEEPTLSAQLHTVKNISAEIGEYLRFLKTVATLDYSHSLQNGHPDFFKFTKDETNNIQVKNQPIIVETPPIAKESVVEKVDTVTEEPVSRSINDIYKNKPLVDEEIPVFIPATIPQKTSNTPNERTEKVQEEEEIPVFTPAVVPSHSTNSSPKEEAKITTDEIPVFTPAVIPDRSKKIVAPIEKEVTTSLPTEQPNQSLADIIRASSQQILKENQSKEKELPSVDLNTIPETDVLNQVEEKRTMNPNNLEDDFINAIEKFGDIEESDMDFEEIEIENLEEIADRIDHENKGVSMDQLNKIVDDVIEEEARDAQDLSQNDEEELSDLLNILEDNQVQGNDAEEDTDITELLEEEDVEEPLIAGFKVNSGEILDQELARLIAEVEDRTAYQEEEEDEDEEDDLEEINNYFEEEMDTSPPIVAKEPTTEELKEMTTHLSKIYADEYDEEEDDDEEEDEYFLQTDNLISRAYQHFEEEDWDGGLMVLNQGLSNRPEDADLRFQYALALAKHKNDFGGATRQLEILLGFDQQHEEAFFLLGELAELHKDYLTAKNYYGKVADINPDFPEIYYRLGIITNLHFDDQKELAATYFKRATKKNKLNADAHYRLGILMSEHFENHLKAVKYFKKVLAIQPEHPFANYDLAILYHRLSDRALANIYYQKAVDINPELKTPDNDEAFKYELIGKVDEIAFSHKEEGPEKEELARDMARLETKMARMAQENAIAKNQVLADLDKEFSEDALEDLYEEEIREIPAPVVKHPPKPPAKTILITGATSGIGRATAELFAENGYRIIMTGRRAERLNELKDDFENRFDTSVRTLPFDVRNIEEVKAAIDSLESEWREIDILLNNAGLAKGTGPIHEGNLDHWEQMIDTNIKGLLYMTRAIVPHMVANRAGHIINIASSAGKEVYPGGNVYCATKHAVDALTRAMRIDLHSHNVRVSQVAPGMVEETEFSLVRYDGDADKAKIYDDFNPLTARDVAEVIYFVATRPKHVNVQDVLMFGTQQANSIYTNRNGRE